MRAKEITSSFHTLLQDSCSRYSILNQELHRATRVGQATRGQNNLCPPRCATLAETTKVFACANKTIAFNVHKTNQLCKELATEIALWRGWNARKELSPMDSETNLAVARAQLEARDVCVASLEVEFATAANN